MATNKGLLENPNAATQTAPGAVTTPAPQQGQPMQTTSATQPSTNAPKPGQVGTGNQVGPTTQQVVPKPGNKPLLIKDSVAEYEDAFGFDPKTMTVEGRLEGLLSEDNKLVQQARDRTSAESAARGLRNSSIAVQAGEEAAYNAALPIAQADAQNALAVRTAAFGAAVEDQLLQKQHDFDLVKIDQEYQNNRGLAEQAFGFNTQLAEQSFGHNMALGEQAGEYQLGAARIGAAAQKASAKISAAASTKNAELNAKAAMERQLAGQEYGTSEREAGQEYQTGSQQRDFEQRKELSQQQIDAAASEGYLNREQQLAIANAQLSVSQQQSYAAAVTNVMSSTQSAIGNAAASGAKNANEHINTIKREGEHMTDAVTKIYSSGAGAIDTEELQQVFSTSPALPPSSSSSSNQRWGNG